MEVAPVLLFTYKRLDVLKQTVAALQMNFLAGETELFIFSDGSKSDIDKDKVELVRNYIKQIEGFKRIVITESSINRGLANSIIDGVSQVISNYGKVIVLEDDLITSCNFLSFMNQSLDYYYSNSKVFSIAGFSFPIRGLDDKSIYFTQRASSWGWATWKDRWNDIDWSVEKYALFKNNLRQRHRFNQMGSDMAHMLDKQMQGKIDSWAIRWCFHQFQNDTFTVCPGVSKVRNIGFVEGATHTKDSFNRYETKLDISANEEFNFTDKVALQPEIIKQIVKHYSILSRIKYKLLNTGLNVFNKTLKVLQKVPG